MTTILLTLFVLGLMLGALGGVIATLLVQLFHRERPHWAAVVRVRRRLTPPAHVAAGLRKRLRPEEHLVYGPATPVELDRTGPLVVRPPVAWGFWAPPAHRAPPIPLAPPLQPDVDEQRFAALEQRLLARIDEINSRNGHDRASHAAGA